MCSTDLGRSDLPTSQMDESQREFSKFHPSEKGASKTDLISKLFANMQNLNDYGDSWRIRYYKVSPFISRDIVSR